MRTPTKKTPSNTRYYNTSSANNNPSVFLEHAKQYPIFSRNILEQVIADTNCLIAKLYLQEAIEEIDRYNNTPSLSTEATTTFVKLMIESAQNELRPSTPPGLSTPAPTRIHYCGDPDCDWGCGIQRCGGCIDVCRCR